jgi:hydroxymethylbilane synthase
MSNFQVSNSMPSPLTPHPSPLKIGASALWQAEFTRSELARVGEESDVVVFAAADEFFSPKDLEEALLRGEIDVAVHSMKNLPTSQLQALAITAVSQRDNPADWLVIRRESVVSGKIFKLKEGATVGVSSPSCKAQLSDFRPDVFLKNSPPGASTRLENLRSGDFDAIFLAAVEVRNLGLDLSDFEVVELNPREFVPTPAQGVLAWRTNRDDTATRLILKKIHHPEVSACTNVERRVLQILELPLGVYCERDATGNFHAFAAGEIEGKMRRARLSSSTNFGIAEKLAADLRG